MTDNELITEAILHEDWSPYDQKKMAAALDPNFYTGEPWETHFLNDLLVDVRKYRSDKAVLVAIFLSCAELKMPSLRKDFICQVVDKLFG